MVDMNAVKISSSSWQVYWMGNVPISIRCVHKYCYTRG